MGPTWSPPGADRTQVGPVLATWTLLSGNVSILVRAPPNFWVIGVVFSYPCKTHLLVSTYKTPCRCLCIFTQPHLNSLNSVKICFISSNMLAEMSSFFNKNLTPWLDLLCRKIVHSTSNLPTTGSFSVVFPFAGTFMYADSRWGTVAQKTYLTSVITKFETGACLSFYLFLKSTENTRLGIFRYELHLVIFGGIDSFQRCGRP